MITIYDHPIYTRRETWFDNAAKVKDYMSANEGKLPNERSANPHEKKLGKWIANQKAAAKKFTKEQKKYGKNWVSRSLRAALVHR